MMLVTCPSPGEVEQGVVDAKRRRLFMALPTGPHMLSRALLDECDAATFSSRPREKICTIDTDASALDEWTWAKAEALVNDLIEEDRLIRAWFPTADEIDTLPLRRAPKVQHGVRIVQIGASDMSPRVGPHGSRTAQVGLVRVHAVERYKRNGRVWSSASSRARAQLISHDDILRALAQQCAQLGVIPRLAPGRSQIASTVSSSE